MEPESGTLARELSRVEGQASHMKTRFNVLKAKFPLPSRLLLDNARSIELGEQIEGQKARAAEVKSQQRQQQGRAKRFEEKTGVTLPDRARQNLQPEDAGILADFLNGPSAPVNDTALPSGSSIQHENGKVIYKIKPFRKGENQK